MSCLRSVLERYLSMRQGLGYKYQHQARRLAEFVSFMEGLRIRRPPWMSGDKAVHRAELQEVVGRRAVTDRSHGDADSHNPLRHKWETTMSPLQTSFIVANGTAFRPAASLVGARRYPPARSCLQVLFCETTGGLLLCRY